MTKKKKILIIFTTIIIISLLINILGGTLHKHKAQSAISKVAAARKVKEPAADDLLAHKVQLLTNAGVIGQKIADSKSDICSVNSKMSEGGWTTQGWYQNCYLRYVVGYSTALSREDVVARLDEKDPIIRSTYGLEYSLPDTPSRLCNIYSSDRYYTSLMYIPAHIRSASKVTASSCEIPNLVSGSGGLAESVFSGEPSVKFYRSFDPSSIDDMANQIWIMFDMQYYHEDIGCRLSLNPFTCETNPRPQPSHPSI